MNIGLAENRTSIHGDSYLRAVAEGCLVLGYGFTSFGQDQITTPVVIHFLARSAYFQQTRQAV